MSRKYKFHDKEGLYFVSFATVYWMDVFVRDHYFMEIAASPSLSSSIYPASPSLSPLKLTRVFNSCPHTLTFKA